MREDIYDRLKERITVGMKLGVCQLSKLYAYNGLVFSSGKRIETELLWEKDAIVVIENPTAVYKDIDVITVEDTTKSGDVRKYKRVEKKQDIPVELFDGEGLISPEFSEEIDRIYCGKHIHNSYQIRLPYIKGMVHEINFHNGNNGYVGCRTSRAKYPYDPHLKPVQGLRLDVCSIIRTAL